MERILQLPDYDVHRDNISPRDILPQNGVDRITPKGVSSSAFQRAWEAGYTGYGMKVAVLDTGVDNSHPDIMKAIISRHNYTSEANITVPHGTHVAGTIAADGLLTGGAPGAKIMDYQVLGRNGGSIGTIAQAIKDASDAGAHIINMSLGATGVGRAEIQILKSAIQYAWYQGTVCIAAAGNDGVSICTPDAYSYPASLDSVESIAACDVGENLDTIRLAYFSNENNEVDMAATGLYVISTVLNGKYAVFSGTSMATPHVSAMAAVLGQYLKQTQPQLQRSAFCEALVDLLNRNLKRVVSCAPTTVALAGKVLVRKQEDPVVPANNGNISFGRGFVRYGPNDGPYQPRGQPIFDKGKFLGHYY